MIGDTVSTAGITANGDTVGDKGFCVGIVSTGELVVETGEFDGADTGERVDTTGPGEGREVGLIEIGLIARGTVGW